MNNNMQDIRMQVMWNRLISVVEEQAMTLLRTAFSTSVREAGDLSAGVYDAQGRMLAQAITGTPGHVNTMAESVQHFIAEIGYDHMFAGDTYLTNDPWKGTGHLHDITVVTPSFRHGTLIGFFACTAHVVDIGGRGFGADGKSIYEEGLQIPIMKFAERGQVNQDLLRIVRLNVRAPDSVVGDLYSLANCNDVGHQRLQEMLDELQLHHLETLAEFIFSRTRAAMQERIQALPHSARGTWHSALLTDGYDQRIRLKAAVTIKEDGVHVDFDGTDAASPFGINVPLIYAKAYACYAIQCVVAPDIPNNAASLAPFTVDSPANILNAQRPAPVALRHVLGHMVPDLVLGALAQALPGQIQAEGAAALWNIHISARPTLPDAGKQAEMLMFNSGGMGARVGADGLSTTAFPSGVHTMPIEATEHCGPIVVWKKELRPNSGGAGQWRGGLGSSIEIAPLPGHEFDFSAMFDRVHTKALGRNGGLAGASGQVWLKEGETLHPLRPKGWQHVGDGQRLLLHLPGGGGFGDVLLRDPQSHANDVQQGYVMEDAQ